MGALTPQLVHSLKHYSKADFTKDLISSVCPVHIILPIPDGAVRRTDLP